MDKHYLGHRKRLKEKFANNSEALYDYEILELLLGYVIKGKDVKPVAKEILKKHKNFQEILNSDLTEIKGIGKETDIFFKIISEYVKRLSYDKIKEDYICIDSPDKVFNFLKHLIGFDNKENFVTLYLNSQNKIISHEIVSSGTINQAVVFPREIAKSALDKCAVSVIFAHNHPSGNTNPSDSDINLTNKLTTGLKLFDISVLDHLIITKNNYYSMKQNGDI
jgi:DNA repair protein RadC